MAEQRLSCNGQFCDAGADWWSKLRGSEKEEAWASESRVEHKSSFCVVDLRRLAFNETGGVSFHGYKR
jgi:hypothetical protein